MEKQFRGETMQNILQADGMKILEYYYKECWDNGEKFKIGKKYKEQIAVKNTGTINQYCRASIYKYWLNPKGESDTSMSPDLIELNIPQGNGWIMDEAASTLERTVMYYTKLLNSGETTPNVIDTLNINPNIQQKVTQTKSEQNGVTTLTTTYDYNGCQFYIEVKVDSIQEHNAEDAIWSAWAIRVNIASDGTLSLL